MLIQNWFELIMGTQKYNQSQYTQQSVYILNHNLLTILKS
jgi:hypothetical protein